MRIAYVLSQFPNPTEVPACLEVTSLIKLGHEVEVFCLRSPHELTETFKKSRGLENVPIHYAPQEKGNSSFGDLLKFLPVALGEKKPVHKLKTLGIGTRVLKLTQLILAGNFDVVNVYWGHYPAAIGLLVKQAAPKTHVTICLRHYDLHLGLEVTRRALKVVDSCVVIGEAGIPLALELGANPDTLKVIYDGADVDYFDDLLKKEVVRDPNKIVSAGRLVKTKAFDLVLKAFAQAKEEFPELSLHIAGEGPERESLEQQAKDLGVADRVTFHGHVDQKSLFEHLRSSAAFLFMSEYEMLPNVVKEAGLARVPVITAESLGMKEMIPNDDYGFVVDINDWETASKDLVKVLRDKNLSSKVTGNLLNHIREEFNVWVSVNKYLSLWRNA